MYRKVKAFIEENSMISEQDTVIAGISGGSDSIVMLYMLSKYKEEKNFNIKAVHVHHGIRGKEADRDRDFVEKTCKILGVDCISYEYDVPKLAKMWKTGTEDAGRRVRKEVFAIEGGKALGKAKIALAHNKNDVAETFLHNLARGSGLKGLSSMPAVSGEIIRPILCLEKSEILNYLKEKEILYVTDSSNLSDDYTRNRIRRHILPLMEEGINKRTIEHIAETAKIAGEAQEYLERQGKKLFEQYLKQDDKVLLSRDFFDNERILCVYAIQNILEFLSGKRKDITSLHIKKILEMQALQTGRRISLPYGIEAIKVYEGVLIQRKDSQEKNTEKKEYFLEEDETLKCKMGCFHIKKYPYDGQEISEKKYTKWLDYDKIKSSLCIRTRRDGDFFYLREDGGKKRLNRFFIDEKIPAEQRDIIPLVAAGDEILWVVGNRINARYKISSSTKYILELNYEGGVNNEREN